jgi:hypothetical protein
VVVREEVASVKACFNWSSKGSKDSASFLVLLLFLPEFFLPGSEHELPATGTRRLPISNNEEFLKNNLLVVAIFINYD